VTKTNTSAPTATKTHVPTQTPTEEPTLGIGSTMINPVDGTVMVYVPGGEFLMGNEAYQNESPERVVYLDSFWIYQTEVTNSQYRMCVEVGACSGELSRYPNNELPAGRISWFDAEEYCNWIGGKLPTEAEWEKAARGIDGRLFPWGDDNPDRNLTNYNNNEGSVSVTSEGYIQVDIVLMPVKSYPLGTSPYGAFDMAGNVWEWVADWYDEIFYRVSPNSNPTGPEIGTLRVLRGGGAMSLERDVRTSNRRSAFPADRALDYGFRCVFTESD